MKGKDKDVGDKITSNCLPLYESIFFLVWDSHRMRDEGWRIVGSMKRSWFKNLKMIFYRQQYARMQFWMLVSSFICLSSNLNLLCPSMAIGYIIVVQTWLGSFAEAILRPHCFVFVFFLLPVLTHNWPSCSISIKQSLCSRHELGGLIGEMRGRAKKSSTTVHVWNCTHLLGLLFSLPSFPNFSCPPLSAVTTVRSKISYKLKLCKYIIIW